MRPLIWVSKSLDKLARALREMGHAISANTVAKLLVDELEFSRQNNRKADDGSKHPDRDAQFEHINAKVVAAQAAGQPVISVDTKKKELIGAYKNGGSDYRPKGDPQRVKVHDFEDKKLGKVVPYGVYDVGANAGWVSVGMALEGGAAEARRREQPRAARQPYPPGTSKWNKIEHRMFCHITQNWRAKPLESRVAVVELIGATTTKTGLKVACALDERTYEKGIRIKKAEMKLLDIEGDTFHPEWNYTIKPRRPQNE